MKKSTLGSDPPGLTQQDRYRAWEPVPTTPPGTQVIPRQPRSGRSGQHHPAGSGDLSPGPLAHPLGLEPAHPSSGLTWGLSSSLASPYLVYAFTVLCRRSHVDGDSCLVCLPAGRLVT